MIFLDFSKVVLDMETGVA